MPQTNLSYIQIFHRDNYPYYTNKGVIASPAEEITVLIDPSFTEIENKDDDFFSLKPRRLNLGVVKSTSTFFNVSTSPLTPHENYPTLSDYLARGFDSSDNMVFEGIIGVEGSENYDMDVVDLIIYDPICILSDNNRTYLASTLQAYYTAPQDLIEKLFNDVMGDYFTNNATGYMPEVAEYTTDWNIPDWNLGSYQLLKNWDTSIADFYDLAEGDWLTAATSVIGTPTAIYDYSKIEVHRGRDFKYAAVFNFIGCIVYYNASNGRNYAVIWHNGAYYNPNSGVYELSDNIELADAIVRYYGSGADIDTFGHELCQYFTSRIVYNNCPAVPIFVEGFYPTFFNVIDYFKYYKDTYIGSPKSFFATLFSAYYKAQVNARIYPQWRSLSGGNNYREYLGIDSYRDYHENKGNYYYSEYGLLDEGGDPIKTQSLTGADEDYIYKENNNSVFYGYPIDETTPRVISQEVDFSEGIFDLGITSTNENRPYKFKINYGDAYPFTDNISGIPLYKIGNISRLIGYLPINVTYAPYASSSDYIWNDTGSNKFSLSDLIKFFLASMNLYMIYSNGKYNFYTTYYTNGTAITISDVDVVGFETNTTVNSAPDLSNVLSLTLNYIPEALEPFYIEAAKADNKSAKCKISRCPSATSVYTLAQNSKVIVRGQEWKIEKINPFLAFYEVTLNKYLEEPIV